MLDELILHWAISKAVALLILTKATSYPLSEPTTLLR